ncbi:NADP-dependent oxidoreductase [Chitinophaga oryzae]|uniref:NADP-dependent oxidoreductase n=1 Tax=Chitinophaga oryzae TaxID=2725414 RepID=A0AAE6ZEH4_9BACT|nr:NADP-dependent oxidoreductase [Chitinophaga oryzae]QJB31287.1 NADP-dependent oxidoreductase [Chitinophaga oryzae]QJB37774.1 NADP-dependent oxidoreductase [Chitinophaga oryzae]
MKIQQILLNERPEGLPAADTFKTVDVELPGLNDGEVLLQPLYFSVDPYMRGRMSDARSYIPPFKVQEPIESGGVATVTESKDARFAPGDLVMPGGGKNFFPWATGFVFSGDHLRKIDASIPPSYYLGVLGMPGLTAYFGLMDIGKPKAGETVVISGAAGAVGLVAGQIAKIQGCRVVGIAGGEEKVKLLTSDFNFDAAINYKGNTHLGAAVAAACPNGVDIYFDNVGGEISDAVMEHLNFFARIPVCGQIALYNSTEVPIGPRVQPTLIKFSVLMQGFTIGNYAHRYLEGIQQLGEWIRAGKIKYTETIIEGFDQLPAALLGLFSGQNSGKMIVKV